ncbi:MAG TPA: hypothetical protein DIC52_03845 [Candidatus Latescibacteria bacterium]|nr:hypothetical protein [Candidatus Latescibacterota bacterium]
MFGDLCQDPVSSGPSHGIEEPGGAVYFGFCVGIGRRRRWLAHNCHALMLEVNRMSERYPVSVVKATG